MWSVLGGTRLQERKKNDKCNLRTPHTVSTTWQLCLQRVIARDTPAQIEDIEATVMGELQELQHHDNLQPLDVTRRVFSPSDLLVLP